MTGFDNPLLIELDESFETERLVIRAPRAQDGPALHEAIVESFEALHRWIPWATHVPTTGEAMAMARRDAARWALREDLRMLLFRKDDGALAGGCGLYRINWRVPRFEVGYWLRTSMEGQGYMTEAVRGMTRWAFEGLGAARVDLHCDSRNAGSMRVAERCGYQLEATLRQCRRDSAGDLLDLCIFAITRAEYAAVYG